MRTLLFALCAVLYCLIGILLWLVIWILKIFNKNAADNFSFYCIRFACRLGTWISGAQLDVTGLENIPTDEPAYFIMNHRSIFDIVLTYPFMKRPTGFIAKKELSRIPFFSYWLTLAHGLFLDRTNIRQGFKTIQKAINKLNNRISMCIFPEGTRNKDREHRTSLLEFHGGSFKPAEKTGVPIIPVVLYNTAECFENHFPFIRAANVKIAFGKPIVISELSPENRRFLSQHVQSVMQNMLNAFEA